MPTDPEFYAEILDLLIQAELAARNHEWATCGTASRRAMEAAFKRHEELIDANS